MPSSTHALAVRIHEFGGPDVLRVEEIPMPVPADGEVLVEVKAAGMNPGELAIRSGAMEEMWPSTLPSGQGSDLAGIVVEVGPGITDFAVGDEVLGFSWKRSSQATHVAVPASQLIPKPAALDWPVAGSLYVVGVTSYVAVHTVAPVEGETVVVSAAAGGVGTLVVQLLRLRGVNVIGIAGGGASNVEWLESHGATAVAYGDDLADRIRAVAPNGVDAFIDLFGPQYIDLALELGVPVDRIETIISFARAAEVGARSEGSESMSTPAVMSEMAEHVAAGRLEFPVAATYPLADVQLATAQLEQRHTHGKIVLLP